MRPKLTETSGSTNLQGALVAELHEEPALCHATGGSPAALALSPAALVSPTGLLSAKEDLLSKAILPCWSTDIRGWWLSSDALLPPALSTLARDGPGCFSEYLMAYL